MSQLGSGRNSSFPRQIDTRQVYRNGSPSLPDSDTRLDSEFANDCLHAIITIQTALGTNPGGVYPSVAARLNQFLPGGGVVPNVQTFSEAMLVTIPGTIHQVASALMLTQVYSTATGTMDAMEPDSLTIHPTTYDVQLSFAVPQTGAVVLVAPPPLYLQAFTGVTQLRIPAATHGLATPAPFFQVVNDAVPAAVIQPGSVTVNAATLEVVIDFAVAQSGRVLLSSGGTPYVTAFTATQSVTIPGVVHQLGSSALLVQVYDTSTPARAFLAGTVDIAIAASTFDVTLTFAVPQAGTVAICKAGDVHGEDFMVRDAGIPNQTAVQVFSQAGALNLQAGSDDRVTIRNKAGTSSATFDTSATRLGLGTTTPSFQLQLTADSAAKPGTNTWTVSSDARLKEVLRPYTDGLALICALKAYWYRYTGAGGMPRRPQEQVGLLAQDLQPLAPYMVGSYEGTLTPGSAPTEILTYEGHAMTFALINAVQELTARLTTLETAHAALTEAYTALTAPMPPPEEPLP